MRKTKPRQARAAKRGPGRPRGGNSDETRTRILRAARTCFAAQSFTVTTNRDIADRAGVTAPALYQYFESKLALYAAAAHEAVLDIAAHMRAHAANQDSTAGALREVMLSLLALHDRDPTLAQFFAALHFESQRDPRIAQAIEADRNAIVAVMAEVVLPGVARGELEQADVGRVIGMFIACSIGLSQFTTTFDRTLLGGAVNAYCELLDGTLFRHKRGRTRAARVARTR